MLFSLMNMACGYKTIHRDDEFIGSECLSRQRPYVQSEPSHGRIGAHELKNWAAH